MRKGKACCFVCFSVSRRFGWPLLGCPLWSVRKENVVFEWCREDETILSRAARLVTRGCISTVVSLNTSQPCLLCIKTTEGGRSEAYSNGLEIKKPRTNEQWNGSMSTGPGLDLPAFTD